MIQLDKYSFNIVDIVVDEIISDLTIEERVSTADLNEGKFCIVELTLRKFRRHR